jgi:hypothetical protein
VVVVEVSRKSSRATDSELVRRTFWRSQQDWLGSDVAPRDSFARLALGSNQPRCSLRQHRHHCHRHSNASVAAFTPPAHLIND